MRQLLHLSNTCEIPKKLDLAEDDELPILPQKPGIDYFGVGLIESELRKTLNPILGKH